MANNIISACLEKDADTFSFVLKGCDTESSVGIRSAANERSDYAAKLDRLVIAAKDALTDLCHFPWCNLYNGDNCSCGIGPVKDELTAALREIELTKELK